MRLASVVSNCRVLLSLVLVANFLFFLIDWKFTDLSLMSLFVIELVIVILGLLIFGLSLGLSDAWRSGTTAQGNIGPESGIATTGRVLQGYLAVLPSRTVLELILGPAVGLLIWWMPLGLEPVAHKATAVVGLMLVYWITAVLDYGVTALLGCVLFWLLNVVPPQIAFSGFSAPTPWFSLGGLLIGQAVAQTGLAKRLGYYALYAARGSSTRLLLVFSIIIYFLSFFLVAAGQVALLAPVAIGIVASLGLAPHSNMAKGLFLMMSYVSSLYDKGVLASNTTIIAWGLLQNAGIHVLWGQWYLAFLPLTILTIFASWLIIRWLYPPETVAQSPNHASWHDMVRSLGPWSPDEYKVLCWTLLAIGLWFTDFLHHTSPAAISITIGLLLSFPRLGVLDAKAIKSVNFWAIVFIAGAISMSAVLTETHVLDSLATLFANVQGALSNAWRATLTIYWGGFLYHFLMGSEPSMISSLLPVLLKVAATQGYNPVAMSMLCVFAGSGKLFAYQNGGLALGYSYGFFQVRDLLKVGAVLTVVEGLFILLLVLLYWPLVGLPWTMTPPSQAQKLSAPVEIGQVEQSAKRLEDVSPMPQSTSAKVSEERQQHREALSRSATRDSAMVSAPATSRQLDAETAAWASIRDSTASQDFTEFLTEFPQTRFAFAARMRLRQLHWESQIRLPSIPSGER